MGGENMLSENDINKIVAKVMDEGLNYSSSKIATEFGLSNKEAYDLVAQLRRRGLIKRSIIDASTSEPDGMNYLFGRLG